jgi:hypothetical protein
MLRGLCRGSGEMGMEKGMLLSTDLLLFYSNIRHWWCVLKAIWWNVVKLK